MNLGDLRFLELVEDSVLVDADKGRGCSVESKSQKGDTKRRGRRCRKVGVRMVDCPLSVFPPKLCQSCHGRSK